ncbi:MAG TPA: hypothetical protein VK997_03310, partial [Deferrisomatales bacterium]|nr:hypothetical protein [Deferrisomatales bacterium]
MTPAHHDDTQLRRLLSLEAQPDPAFAVGARSLCHADGLVLLTPTGAGNLRVALCSATPADVEGAVAGATVDPASHPLLFPLNGAFHLQVGDLSAV